MSNSNEAIPRITRPRRSILGLRSKLFSANSNKEETGPLYSSSPVEKNKFDAYNTGTGGLSALKKSCSSPSLVHPFEANDTNSSLFFTKGHSESEWSVFKPTKKVERISNCKPRPSVSRKLINDTTLRIEEEKEEDAPKYSDSNWGRTKTLDGYRSNRIKKSDGSSQLSVEQKLGLQWLAYEFRSNSKNSGEHCDDLNDTLKEPILGKEIQEQTDEDKPKYDSNWGRTKTLEGYRSNGIKKSICNENNLLSKENDCGDESSELSNILGQLENLKECKEEMDATLTSLLRQKEEFDKKWNLVTSALSRYTTNNISESHDKNSTIVNKRKSLFNRECDEKFISSFSSKCKLKSSQQFNELKENFNCIQTPVISNKKQLRKSICYTPNSLSAVIGAQASAIFDDDI